MDVAHLNWLDWLAVVVYVLALAGVLALLGRRRGDRWDSEAFFLGGRRIPWWAIGCSLFASNVGTDHLVGLAGSGAATGLSVGLYEWNACLTLLVLAYVFVPRYLAFHVYTVPEYLEKRFSRGLRTFFMILTIAATLFTKITVTIFAGAVVLQEVLGLNMYTSAVVLLAITAIYCSVGGLAAVMYTEVLQVGVVLAGTAALLGIGLQEVGGWGQLRQALDDSYFKVGKPITDPDYPWPGVVFGMTINSIWYWCTDQVMVQRALGTDSPADSQRGCVLASCLKITPMYLMVLPGLIAAALFPRQMAEDSNKAFPVLVVNLMPHGLIGVMVAAMLSSFMAALASCFNSCSTLFTMDVFRVLVPDASERTLVVAGRGFTLLVAAISLCWLPVIDGSHSQLFLYIQGVQIIWCAPLAVLFIGSVVSSEVTTLNAWVTLIFGLLIGTLYWALKHLLTNSAAHALPVIGAVHDLAILLYTLVAFALCALVMTVTYLLDPTRPSRRGSSEAAPLMPRSMEKFNDSYSKQEWAGCGTGLVAFATAVAVVAQTVYFW